MIYQDVLQVLRSNPVIAGIRDTAGLENALNSPVEIIFLLNAALSNLKKRVKMIHAKAKMSFIHLEMVAGISKEPEILKFLKMEINPTGIITSNPNMVQPAHKLGLLTVQRIFVFDSLSVQTGIKMVQMNQPDFVEIMPASMYKVMPMIRDSGHSQIISGGLITTEKEIVNLLKTGVLAVCTSKKELWKHVSAEQNDVLH